MVSQCESTELDLIGHIYFTVLCFMIIWLIVTAALSDLFILDQRGEYYGLHPSLTSFTLSVELGPVRDHWEASTSRGFHLELLVWSRITAPTVKSLQRLKT